MTNRMKDNDPQLGVMPFFDGQGNEFHIEPILEGDQYCKQRVGLGIASRGGIYSLKQKGMTDTGPQLGVMFFVDGQEHDGRLRSATPVLSPKDLATRASRWAEKIGAIRRRISSTLATHDEANCAEERRNWRGIRAGRVRNSNRLCERIGLGIDFRRRHSKLQLSDCVSPYRNQRKAKQRYDVVWWIVPVVFGNDY